MTGLFLVLAIFASARTFRLVVKDDVTWWFRDLLGQLPLPAWFWEMYGCPWCLGFYISAGWVASALAWGNSWEWQLVAGALAVNYVQAQLTIISRDNQ